MSMAALPAEIIVKIVEDVLFPHTVHPPDEATSAATTDPGSDDGDGLPADQGLSSPTGVGSEADLTVPSSPASDSLGWSAPPTSRSPQPLSPINVAKDAQVLRSVSRRFSQAADLNLGKRFHSFEPAFPPIVRAHCTHWLPRLETSVDDEKMYWRCHLRTTNPTINQLRLQAVLFDKANADHASSIKIDARVADYEKMGDQHFDSRSCFDQWCASFVLICRLGRPNPALKTLHLRFSLHTEITAILHSIFRQSHALTDVVIEADYPGPFEFFERTSLRLDDCFETNRSYSSFERFIIRAPGLRLEPSIDLAFFGRFKTCKTFCVAVKSVDTAHNTSVPAWVNNVLSMMDSAVRVEVSIGEGRMSHFDSNHNAICNMPHLEHLTLDFAEVSAHLLDLIRAPKLRYIRIRSAAPIGGRGSCAAGRFSSLVLAALWCPDGVHERFRALGLAKRQFVDELPSHLVDLDHYNGEVQCHIKKFLARPGDSEKAWYKRRRLN